MARQPARPSAVFTPAIDQATAGFGMPLEELVASAGRAGLPVLEVPAFAVAAHLAQHGPDSLAALLKRCGVRIGQLSCGSGTPADATVPDVAWPAALEAWRRSCRTAVAAGYGHLSVFVPRSADGLEAVAGRLRELTAVADRTAPSLVVSVEVHAPGLLRHAGRLLELAPEVSLLVDVAAVALAGLDPVEHVRALAAGSVGWVHLADLPSLPVGGQRPGRVLPGAGCLPLPQVLDALWEGGYRGPVSVEVPARGPGRRHVAAAGACLASGPLARYFRIAAK